MKNNFYSIKPFKKIFAQPNTKSEVISDLLYGEKFKILLKKGKWIKIKTMFDNYTGYIKNDYHTSFFKPDLKTFKLSSQIFKKKKGKFYKTKSFITFGSKIENISSEKNFIEFEKNKWLKSSNLKKLSHKIKNYKKLFQIFLNVKYKWGGKNFTGIDCSGLIQLFYYYNNNFCPRDTKDQLPFFKKKTGKINKIKKDIIFWKGHVAISLNKSKLIHAYGPEKRVLIMNKRKTFDRIFKDTKLKPIFL